MVLLLVLLLNLLLARLLGLGCLRWRLLLSMGPGMACGGDVVGEMSVGDVHVARDRWGKSLGVWSGPNVGSGILLSRKACGRM